MEAQVSMSFHFVLVITIPNIITWILVVIGIQYLMATIGRWDITMKKQAAITVPIPAPAVYKLRLVCYKNSDGTQDFRSKILIFQKSQLVLQVYYLNIHLEHRMQIFFWWLEFQIQARTDSYGYEHIHCYHIVMHSST